MKEKNEQQPTENKPTFKQIILSRYCGEFLPANEKTATIRKTSEEIMMDLRPMADLSTNEIAEYMTLLGYTIGFDDATPVWLMRKEKINEIENP